MNKNNISCQVNDISHIADATLFAFANHEIAKKIVKFHKSLPGYNPTPVVHLSKLANKLGVNKLMIKDESQRFDLNAFKVLGASYAIAEVLKDKLKLDDGELTFANIASNAKTLKDLTFVTATDGNHGRAVAWVANKFGCDSMVYLPKGSSLERLSAIQQFATKALITTHNYDDTVNYAKKMAKDNGWILLQDTSWDGYEKIPTHIMQGYFTLITEYLEQETNTWPTHVFLQAGVGSLAAAILAYFYSFNDKPAPIFVIVEPEGAPCLYESIKIGGKLYKVDGDLETIMAGLACGEPSHIGLQILKQGASFFIKCSDDIAMHGMRVLGNPLSGDAPIISGESGAVTLGVVHEILSNKSYKFLKELLRITHDSKILLFSTEGDTDKQSYRNIVC